MRIYKTRYDFENLDQSEIFPGTICTIIDEVDNPTYIYQNSIWNAFVTVPQSEEINPTGVYINSNRAAVPVFTNPPLVAIAVMGDSIMQQNTGTRSTNSHGLIANALSYLGHPWDFQPTDNFAVGGTNIATILAEQVPAFQALAATRRYERVFISSGTNDTNAGTALATIKAGFSTLFMAIREMGAIPVHIGILPRGNDASLSTAKKNNMHLNEWLREQADDGLIEFIDIGETFADNSTAYGNCLAALMYDSVLHPNTMGAALGGKAIADYYTARGIAPRLKFATQAGDLFDRTNNPTGSLFSNPLLQGGTTAPTGMTTSGGTWSKVNRTLANGQVRTDCQCVLAASTLHYLYDDWVTTGDWGATELQPGDILEARAIVEITDGVNISNVTINLAENDGSGNLAYYGLGASNVGFPDGDHLLYLRTPQATIRDYYGSGNASIFARVEIQTAGGASGTAVVKSLEVRKIG